MKTKRKVMKVVMYYVRNNIPIIVFILCLATLLLTKPQNILAQISEDINLPFHQKYIFENDELSIEIQSNQKFIYDNDSCKFVYFIQNKTGKDIYLFNDSTSYFILSYCNNLLRSATIDEGESFDGGIDYYVNLIRIKPNQKISKQITLFSRDFKENCLISDFDVKLGLAYLENDKIDSIKIWYPEYTNIKTEIINENNLTTSAYVLYAYLKRIIVGSLLIEYIIRE